MTMPLLTAMPVKMMKPMMAPMLMVVPVIASSTTTPMKPRGMVNMLMKGKEQVFIQRGHDGKDQHQGDQQGEAQGGEGLGHVLVLAGLLDEIAFGQAVS